MYGCSFTQAMMAFAAFLAILGILVQACRNFSRPSLKSDSRPLRMARAISPTWPCLRGRRLGAFMSRADRAPSGAGTWVFSLGLGRESSRSVLPRQAGWF